MPFGNDVVIMVGATGAVVTVMDKNFVLLPTLLVAFISKSEVPAVVGVPEISPAVESVKPLGRLPKFNDQVIGIVPVAASCALYAVPVTPPGSVDVVMVGGSSTVIDNAFVSLPALLVA